MNITAIASSYNPKTHAAPVAFLGAREDNEKGEKYARELLASLNSPKFLKKKTPEKIIEKLQGENSVVKKAFLFYETYDDSDNYTFTRVLEKSKFVANDIFNIVKESDDDIKEKFLLGKRSPLSTPFFEAAFNNNEDLAIEILNWAKTLDKELQREFFEIGTNSFSTKDQGDYLREFDWNSEPARKFKAAKATFEKENPEISQGTTTPVAETVKKASQKDESPKETASKEASSRFSIHADVKTKFSDIGGMFNVKNQIQEEFLDILQNPNVKNSDKPGGVMLYGGPGTGKTLLATAIAGEAGVPFISTNGASFNELYIGSGALHVRELYKKARELAEGHSSKTTIVFIDEVDALASKRGNSSSGESDKTLNQLLSELDGANLKENSDIKVITICATNRKDMLDDAFMRSGRMDMKFEIEDPCQSVKARKEILKAHAKDKPFESDEAREEILEKLASITSGLSGADLADIIKRAYRKTLGKNRELPYITEKDVTDARIDALAGVRNDAEISPEDKEITLAHEGGHGINSLVMYDIFKDDKNHTKMPTNQLDLLVNESRGNTAGLAVFKPSHKNSNLTVESLLSNLITAYGGYSIEEEMYEGHSAGVAADLENSTQLIHTAVSKWGLGSKKTKFIGCDRGGVTYELFRADIKSDIEQYSTTAAGISKQIAEFTKPFIEEYIKTCKDEIVPGEVFGDMFKKWLTQNGNAEEYEKLCSKIKTDIEAFKKRLKE